MMNTKRNNTKRRKMLKTNKKINERKRDNMPISTNLFFNTLLIVLGGIFILCFVYDFEE